MLESTSRRLALLTVIPVLLALVFGLGATRAQAAPLSTNQPGSLPIPAATSLTVHRRDTAFPLDQGNGVNPGGTLPGEPVPGVTFRAQQVVGIDLLTTQGWQQAHQLSQQWSPQSPSFPAELSEGATTVTNADGDAIFTDLGIGLFLVTETQTPAGRAPSIPFLVTLPMTGPTGTGWLYDVWASPKADLISIDKTVSDDSALSRGDVVTWTITADIPQSADPLNNLTELVITDQLDARLDLIEVSALTIVGANPGDHIALARGTDYTVTPAGPSSAGPLVTVAFTPNGLAVLNNLTVLTTAPRLTFNIDTAVNETVGYGPQAPVIDNQARLDFRNNPNSAPGFAVSGEPYTAWGGVNVLKLDSATVPGPLSGVGFQVFTSEADAWAQANPIVIAGTATASASQGAGYGSIWFTDDAGRVNINHLRAGHEFWLVEVQAAPGYELFARPIPFTVTADSTTVTWADVELQNVPSNAGFALPLVGGTNSQASAGIGVTILLAGAAAVVWKQRSAAQGNRA